jgi:hypothetical protein
VSQELQLMHESVPVPPEGIVCALSRAAPGLTIFREVQLTSDALVTRETRGTLRSCPG